MPGDWRGRLWKTIWPANPRLPYVKDTVRRFMDNGTYREFEVQALWLGDFTGIQFFYGCVRFKAQWANPLWSILDSNLAGAVEKQADLVHAVLGATTRFRWRHAPPPPGHAERRQG